jgi:hypothetical protein
MADYYPLIARAVESLSDPSPEMRRAVYERARSALIGQLQTLDPPLSAAEIEQERLSLDAAIGRVEADYAAQPDSAGVKPAAGMPILRESARLRTSDDAPDLQRPEAPPTRDDEIEDVEEEAVAARPRIESRPHPGMQSNRRTRTVILGIVLALVIAAIAVLAYVNRNRPEDIVAQAPVTAEPEPAAPETGKINERVGGQAPPPPAAAPAPRPDANVAQRSVFYEEDPANPQVPKAQVGRVDWRLEDLNPGQGQALERAVTANIDIPDAGLTMKMVLRRNTDATLPASHTVELTFTTRAGDSGRVIRDVGLLQFKNEEAARGTPVAGLPVPVRENLFLIGLSNLPSDVERNTELFVRRNWIDLPVRMASGQRAILSFEKGTAGEQILNSAFTQWQ